MVKIIILAAQEYRRLRGHLRTPENFEKILKLMRILELSERAKNDIAYRSVSFISRGISIVQLKKQRALQKN